MAKTMGLWHLWNIYINSFLGISGVGFPKANGVHGASKIAGCLIYLGKSHLFSWMI